MLSREVHPLKALKSFVRSTRSIQLRTLIMNFQEVCDSVSIKSGKTSNVSFQLRTSIIRFMGRLSIPVDVKCSVKVRSGFCCELHR